MSFGSEAKCSLGVLRMCMAAEGLRALRPDKSRERTEALLKEYGEVAAQVRSLTEIRFKLLGLLPAATALTAAFAPTSSAFVMLPLALLGLGVAFGLLTYNARNDQLYDELIGRAGHIERELGLAEGAFGNRPGDWLRYGGRWGWPVNHGWGVGLVYSSTIAFWLFLVLHGLGSLAVRSAWGRRLLERWTECLAGFGAAAPPLPKALGLTLFMATAVALTLLAVITLQRLRKAREHEVKEAIRQAAITIASAEGFPAPDDNRFKALLSTCLKVRHPAGAVDEDTKKRVCEQLKALAKRADLKRAALTSGVVAAALAPVMRMPARYLRNQIARSEAPSSKQP